jgi:hypothetical protein
MATKKVTEWSESQSMHFYTSLKEGTTLEDYAKNNNRTLANVQKKCTTVTKQELRENRSVEDIHKTYGIPLDIVNELHRPPRPRLRRPKRMLRRALVKLLQKISKNQMLMHCLPQLVQNLRHLKYV